MVDGNLPRYSGIANKLNVPWFFARSLRWRHNGSGCVSNHQPHDCLLNRLIRRRSKKSSKLCVTGLCAGNSPVTGELPTSSRFIDDVVYAAWPMAAELIPVYVDLTYIPWTKWLPFRRRYFQMHFREWKVFIFWSIFHWSLFLINNKPPLAYIMAWRRKGDKPLSKPMLHRFTDVYMRH